MKTGHLLFATLTFLAACGGGGTSFDAARPVAVTAGPYTLDVYRAGDRVRVERRWRDLRSESDFARVAIPVAERVTGCRVDRGTLTGDPMHLEADLVGC